MSYLSWFFLHTKKNNILNCLIICYFKYKSYSLSEIYTFRMRIITKKLNKLRLTRVFFVIILYTIK